MHFKDTLLAPKGGSSLFCGSCAWTYLPNFFLYLFNNKAHYFGVQGIMLGINIIIGLKS